VNRESIDPHGSNWIDGAPVGDEGGLPALDDLTERPELREAIAKLSSIVRALPPDASALQEVQGVRDSYSDWMIIYRNLVPMPTRKGTGKQRTNEEQLVFNEAIRCALGLSNDLERHINHAIESKDPTTFTTVAEALQAVKDNPSHSKFSRTCLYAMRAERELRIIHGRNPTPTTKRLLTAKLMKDDGLETYGAEESSRWNEVWRATRIGGMDQA
jgi:hypothetical protein